MPAAWSDLFVDPVVVLDGGLSTQVESRGHPTDNPLWTGQVLVQDPDAITRAHRDFVEAGARVVVTASYQVSRAGFVAAGRSRDEADSALLASIEAARAATSDSSCLVAASVGPYGAILHDGSEYRGRYGLERAALVDFHAERLSVLAQGRPDLLAVETLPDVDEAEAIVECLADYPELPAWISVSCVDDATTCADQPVEEAVRAAEGAPTVVAVGVNCTPPQHVSGILDRMAATTDLALVAYPNSGRGWDPRTGWSGTGVAMSDDDVRAWARRAAFVGGCCGVGPADIARVAALLPSATSQPFPDAKGR